MGESIYILPYKGRSMSVIKFTFDILCRRTAVVMRRNRAQNKTIACLFFTLPRTDNNNVGRYTTHTHVHLDFCYTREGEERTNKQAFILFRKLSSVVVAAAALCLYDVKDYENDDVVISHLCREE